VRSSYGDRPEPFDVLWSRWAREATWRWQKWDDELGREMKMRLFFTTGDVILRAEWQPFPTRTREIWEQLGTPHEVLTAEEVHYRWPVIDVKDMNFALYEPEAGVVRARRTCEVVAEAFRVLGGEIVIARAELGTRANGRLVDVRLSDGELLAAANFIVATGPWLAKTLPDVMGERLRTPLGFVFYYGTPPGDQRFTYPNLPSWNLPGVTGWPALGRDNRGFRVRTGGATGGDPDRSDRYIPLEALDRPRKILQDRFPALADAPLLQTHACHYESSVSRNFVIDNHPDLENVWVTGGGNAEAFKFGPVLGDYIANRVTGHDREPELADGFRIPEDKFEETTRRGPPEPGEGEM
jgi:glycine/D-amino acid oxidase-like deaminating enzyme